MKQIAVEGINGSGKTVVIDKLCNLLSDSGLSVGVYAPFHLVLDSIEKRDIYPYWTSDPIFAIDALKLTIEKCEEASLKEGHDIIIFDRHWMTVFTQIDKSKELRKYWGNELWIPTFHCTSTQNHLMRLSTRGYEAEWLQEDSLMSYLSIYTELAEKYRYRIFGEYLISSTDQDLSNIALDIKNKISLVL